MPSKFIGVLADMYAWKPTMTTRYLKKAIYPYHIKSSTSILFIKSLSLHGVTNKNQSPAVVQIVKDTVVIVRVQALHVARKKWCT